MSRRRLVLLCLALVLIVLAWWGLTSARTGLKIRSLERDGVPMVLVAPQDSSKHPGILIAHGFAGSKQLMLGYGYTLAHSGYATLLWDFRGHGANPFALHFDSLQPELESAYAALLEQPEVDPERLAILGHSMGSQAVMSMSLEHPDRFAATVAIAPGNADVSPQNPRNLQLQAGRWDGWAVKNSTQLLLAAGGENGDVAQGRGRSRLIIPNTEHITILFSPISHDAVRDWLNQTFGQGSTTNYVDHRMIWYGLHLAGWLLLLAVIAADVTATDGICEHPRRPLRNWGGLILSPLVATGGVALMSRGGDLQNLGGLLVGGTLAVWFLVAGLVWLGILVRWPRPSRQTLGLGIGLFVLLWVAFGAMAQVVWLPWWLIPARLTLWPLLSLACFPWFLASAVVQQGTGTWKRLLWWFGQSLALLVGLGLAIAFVPELGFMALLLPVFPLLVALFSFTAAQLTQSWSYALGTSLFFGWMIAAVFPLAS